ncbi:hypothetical protein AB0H17_23860 [Streptomyces olivoreticuli]
MSELALPRLEYPFESLVSPLADEVDAECFRWGLEQRIFHLGDPEEYRGTRVGWLAARTAPCATREGLQLLADWQMWLFAFDDGFCDESEFGARPATMIRRVVDFAGVLESGGGEYHAAHSAGELLDVENGLGGCLGRAVESPFRAALADLAVRLRPCAQGYQWARFVSAVQGYFMAQCWEAANRSATGAGGAPPPPTEYVRLRRHSGAVRTCIALTDVADGFALPAEDYDDPEVVAVTDMAVDVACWANDIMSYPKEVARSQIVHSLPAVLGHWRGLDPQQALQDAARMHDEQVRRYLAAERTVRARASEPLYRYLDGLRFWMSGNLSWSLETARYPCFDALEGERYA